MSIPINLDTGSLIAAEDLYTSGLHSKRQVAVVRGQGAVLWDSDGNQYIDCVGGQGTANVGHANPRVIDAITTQAKKLIICPEMFYNDQRALLEQRLCALTGMSRVYLNNSGTEAVEAAIKFARLITGKPGIIAAMRGFHGRTMGSLSATWNKNYRQPFEPLVPGFSHFSYNKIESLENTLDDMDNQAGAAGVILEVVQGEGGVHPGEMEFLQKAQELCRQRGVLLILDEIQTGFGRTGKLFAYEHYNLQPDILCIAKSIAGGLPMGATLLSEKLGSLPPGMHSSTFGGYPLVCAAALATLDEFEEMDLANRAAELGDWFLSELRSIDSPKIREVRGLGLMVGIELRQKVTPLLQALMDEGVLALPAGMTVLRFLPPLVITKEQLAQVVEAVKVVLFSETTGNQS